MSEASDARDARDAREAHDSGGDLPGRLSQTFGVVGGMGVWGMALLVAYPTVQVACVVGQPVLVHLVRWTAMVVALAATLTAWRVYRRAERADDEAAGVTRVRSVRLIGLAGTLISASGLLLLLIEDMATWVIDPCL